jgi:hypothetical protein
MSWAIIEYSTPSHKQVIIKFNDVSRAFIQGVNYVISKINYVKTKFALYCNAPVLNNEIIIDNTHSYLLNYTDDKYNSRFNNLLGEYNKDYKYSALITQYQCPRLIRFHDLDFLEGLMTISKWISVNNWSNFKVNSIHVDSKLYRSYITYDTEKPDYNSIRKLLKSYIIDDLVDIIMGYYTTTCNYGGKCDTTVVYCETLCEIGRDVCSICELKLKSIPMKSPCKVKVRLEMLSR